MVGWWPFGGGGSSSSSNDGLDRDLAAFLDQEARNQQRTKTEIQQRPAPPPHDQPTASPTKPSAPPMLYKDGRYADLWKTYQPPDHMSTTSQNERVRLLKDHAAERDAAISYTASENCVIEAETEAACFERFGFREKLTMCRRESRALERCTMLQAKFLRALGYMSAAAAAASSGGGGKPRTALEEERIQMHADDLYQQMLAHELAVVEAKRQGAAPPVFRPLLSEDNVAKVLGLKRRVRTVGDAPSLAPDAPLPSAATTGQLDAIRNDLTQKLEEKWKFLTPEERMAAEVDLYSRIQEQTELNRDATSAYIKDLLERNERRSQGKQTTADKLHDYWNGTTKSP